MCPPCNTCFLQCTRVHNQIVISICLAIFAQLTAECHQAHLGMLIFPLKIASSHEGYGPPSNTWFLKPITKNASRSVQPFLNSSRQSSGMLVHALPLQNSPSHWGIWTPISPPIFLAKLSILIGPLSSVCVPTVIQSVYIYNYKIQHM